MGLCVDVAVRVNADVRVGVRVTVGVTGVGVDVTVGVTGVGVRVTVGVTGVGMGVPVGVAVAVGVLLEVALVIGVALGFGDDSGRVALTWTSGLVDRGCCGTDVAEGPDPASMAIPPMPKTATAIVPRTARITCSRRVGPGRRGGLGNGVGTGMGTGVGSGLAEGFGRLGTACSNALSKSSALAYLLFGSFSKHLSTMASNSGRIRKLNLRGDGAGRCICSQRILSRVLPVPDSALSPTKGRRPVSISYMTMPNEYMSV